MSSNQWQVPCPSTIPFHSFSIFHFSFCHISAHFSFHFSIPNRVPLSHGGQVYPMTRWEIQTSNQQGIPPMTLAKTPNILCDGHRLYNHTQQSYAQSRMQPITCYYMNYTSVYNKYPIFGYTAIEYTYLIGTTQSPHTIPAIHTSSTMVTYNNHQMGT